MNALTPTPGFSLCVYCGSRHGNDPAWTRAAQATGHWLGTRGGQLVYGGGHNGLMGVVAQATLDAGGRVVGIIPQALVDREVAKADCSELHVVANMHERKAMMAERADAFLALPGGIGTFEELFEVWAWRQLGYHDKPLGLLDAGGYYGALLAFMQHTVASGFVSPWQMELLVVEQHIEPLLETLARQSKRSHREVRTDQI